MEIVKKLGIKKLSIFDGILFNKDGSSATVEGDNSDGFYSSRKSEFRETLKFLEKEKKSFEIINSNNKDLSIKINIKGSVLIIEMGVVYGDDIPKKLLDLNFSLQDTLISGFDDLWLAFKIGIDERELLEKEDENNITKLKKFSETNKVFKTLCNDFRNKEGDEEILTKIIELIKNKNIVNINNEEYLEDLIYLLTETKIL